MNRTEPVIPRRSCSCVHSIQSWQACVFSRAPPKFQGRCNCSLDSGSSLIAINEIPSSFTGQTVGNARATLVFGGTAEVDAQREIGECPDFALISDQRYIAFRPFAQCARVARLLRRRADEGQINFAYSEDGGFRSSLWEMVFDNAVGTVLAQRQSHGG